jgi:iron complex outermembrane receptor protein
MAFRLICGFILLGIAPWCVGAPQQAPQLSPSGLADASLEELMNIEVTSVSKKAQRLSSTAASVFVITAEDIRRSGLELPEVLRLAPGVQVARVETGRWAVAIRGFNNDFSNKLMVLIDGRSIYSDVNPGVMWDMVHVAADDIERIEVIRGPNAALWGENAVNGVISVITKSAKSTQGALVTAEGGSETEGRGTARFGGELGSNAFYRVGGHYADTAPLVSDGGSASVHGWNSSSVDLRMDWNPTAQNSVEVSGQGYHSVLGHDVTAPTASNPFPSVVDAQEHSFSANLMARWQHDISEQSSVEGRISWSHMDYGDANVPQRATTVDAEFQHHILLGDRNDLIWGLEYKDATAEMTPTLVFKVLPSHSDRKLGAIFAQDEITLVPDKLRFVVGVRTSYDTAARLQIEPTGRLLWTPRMNLTTWTAVSRAVHTPSVLEQNLSATLAAIPLQGPAFALLTLASNPDSRPESALSYEAGQRIQVSPALSFDLSAFYTIHQHLLGQESLAPYFVPASGIDLAHLVLPEIQTNVRYGASEGYELSATWSVAPRWKLAAGSDWLRIHTHDYPGMIATDTVTDGGTSPHIQYELRSNLDLTRKLEFDTAVYYVSALPEEKVPSHFRLDVRLGWRMTQQIELSAGVKDALDPQHPEMYSQRLSGLEGIQRNCYGKLTWRF